jgi:hypothetical protein
MKTINQVKAVLAAAVLGLWLAGSVQAQNLILNGSFETNSGTAALGWTNDNNFGITNVPVEFGYATNWNISPAPEGTQVALLPGTNWLYGLLSDTATLTAGTSYRFSYWVRNWSADPNLGAYIYLQNVGQPTDYDTRVYSASQSWQWYTKVFTATGNDTVRFVAWSRGPTYNYTFFDNVTLEEGTYVTNALASSTATGGVSISFFATNSVEFHVLTTTNLSNSLTNWGSIGGTIMGNGTDKKVFDPYGTDSQKFYEVIAIY